ncbi:Ribonuclease H-like domain-containing protein [Cynara cardunculus var. scolymus]|uniref:Ribonuclease H-like domain-containing protein n=1 Tax=Cynara cardunculus var. scolymus TaxID=59895 RepID=A0A103XFM6_CYNCS|nr:Ribonuclease H-like domain-containing protein [Cynara cardunculus var. scolymus]
MHRHLESCVMKAKHVRQQKLINFLPSDSSTGTNQSGFVSALNNGKLDMLKMREGIAHWITMHEHPFSIVEEEGFNLMMKRGIPEWNRVSRVTIKADAFKVYELEKKRLKDLFKKVERVSLTTDLWKSKSQKIEYMVITAHFVDLEWKLQKRVINFVHLPPPRKGANIADCILTCLREWEIEDKLGDVGNSCEI